MDSSASIRVIRATVPNDDEPNEAKHKRKKVIGKSGQINGGIRS